MKYEITNPSDPYTIEAPTLCIAGAATLLLGEGRYGLEAEGEGKGMPIFLFGGSDEWWAEQCPGQTLQCFFDANLPAIADALGSVTLGREERSSMNDIGGRAAALAAALREKIEASA